MNPGRAASQLADLGDGRCAVSGALTIDSVPWLWKELASGGLLTSAREADLTGVDTADSAGLALLVTWKACCRKQGTQLAFGGIPERLLALARLTQAQELLGAAS